MIPVEWTENSAVFCVFAVMRAPLVTRSGDVSTAMRALVLVFGVHLVLEAGVLLLAFAGCLDQVVARLHLRGFRLESHAFTSFEVIVFEYNRIGARDPRSASRYGGF